ncbi:MAG: deoxyguanosinetriphosphate triphosphohydrolase [Thermomicrobiales bacterium]
MTSLTTPRQRQEEWELAALAPAACRSREARRPAVEPESEIRTAFARDRDRVLHAKSFRRLMHKTQVFIAPTADHYRTRLTHTLEVMQIARTIARALQLNEDLVEAIALGHDLGHTPFGHAGERALASCFPGFRHNEQSLRVVDVLERDGRGLNLTDQVRDGIAHHSKDRSGITMPATRMSPSLEGEVVRLADGIAYINHDLDDAIRAGLISIEDVPVQILDNLGHRHSQRIDTLVNDIVNSSSTSLRTGAIEMSPASREVADALREFLFLRVYTPLNEDENTRRAEHIIVALFEYFLANPSKLPAKADDMHSPGEIIPRRVADFVASMTDRYAIELFERIFVPRYWTA